MKTIEKLKEELKTTSRQLEFDKCKWEVATNNCNEAYAVYRDSDAAYRIACIRLEYAENEATTKGEQNGLKQI